MLALSFDTDWMTPSSMDEFISRYPGLPNSTFFLHRSSRNWVPRVQDEFGPHPDIADFGSVDSLGGVTPLDGAIGIRTHSCLVSHMLSSQWAKSGFRYQSVECSLPNGPRAPFRTAWGIWEVPIAYMDNMDLWLAQNWPQVNHEPLSRSIIDRAIQSEQLFVLDFHPLHIALNTRDVEMYAGLKGKVQAGSSPWTLAGGGWGVRTLFEYLLTNLPGDMTDLRIVTNLPLGASH